ncbi:MAG: 2Fe-2S iron-sulfur cluster-binding protein [Pseudomonadota bacterium]
MAQFYPLTVTHVHRDTRESVVVSLRPAPEHAALFTYEAGQYLTFRREFEGEELRRSYSICASAQEQTLKVGIKRVDGGWFSSWANEGLPVGDRVEAMPPAGKFCAPVDASVPRNYLMFAVGSGITPILSLAKTLLEAEPNAKIILTYVNRAFNTIMFREELSDLKDAHMARLTVLHILKHDAGDIELLSGRVDGDKLDQLFTRWMAPRAADMAFICGPEDLMLLISQRLQAHGMAREQIKFELFASTRPTKQKAASRASDGAKDVRATLIVDGQTRVVEMARSETVLEAALGASVEVPFSCRGGVCSTCCGKVVSGQVEMQNNYALEDYEVERGLVLTCQALPLTDEVTISFDEH